MPTVCRAVASSAPVPAPATCQLICNTHCATAEKGHEGIHAYLVSSLEIPAAAAWSVSVKGLSSFSTEMKQKQKKKIFFD